MANWINLLSKLDFFQGLTEVEISPLLSESTVRHAKNKEYLFTEGSERTHLFVLKKGVILISKLTEEGDERVINILSDGEVFPHTGFFDERPYPGTAQVKEDAEVLAIPIKAFERFIEENPHLAFRMIKMMSKKINFLQQKLNEMLSLNVEERLFATLKQMKALNNESLQLTHQEIANIVGASRETITRQMKKLEKQGKITTVDGKIKILHDI
ncbi:Crp/Fnr family transcriptional regulator [Bacillus sp. FJAT-45350]|uniref:Crp/Fnr family transcriptional regulator n=1 Tax=Bacillus sp. FJAT-45350 TaxID=2011014 RepID=UPI0015CC3CCC|nr:Crp/Fnr family transcriptional regulator [Bacillus sp. FJAT-45350]